MSGKLIILMPHFKNCRLRYLNRRIMEAMPVYVPPSESMSEPPDGCVSPQAKYEPLPTPPDT